MKSLALFALLATSSTFALPSKRGFNDTDSGIIPINATQPSSAAMTGKRGDFHSSVKHNDTGIDKTFNGTLDGADGGMDGGMDGGGRPLNRTDSQCSYDMTRHMNSTHTNSTHSHGHHNSNCTDGRLPVNVSDTTSMQKDRSAGLPSTAGTLTPLNMTGSKIYTGMPTRRDLNDTDGGLAPLNMTGPDDSTVSKRVLNEGVNFRRSTPSHKHGLNETDGALPINMTDPSSPDARAFKEGAGLDFPNTASMPDTSTDLDGRGSGVHDGLDLDYPTPTMPTTRDFTDDILF